MRYRFFALSLLVAFFVCVCALFLAIRIPKKPPVVDLRNTLTLEYAESNSARELGLGYRDSLAPHHGMLFVFEKSGIYPFWMKGMRFPLDIIWINHGIVQDVTRLEAPKTEDEQPAWHAPHAFADRVLEVNAGEAAQLGIRSGVQLILPELR